MTGACDCMDAMNILATRTYGTSLSVMRWRGSFMASGHVMALVDSPADSDSSSSACAAWGDQLADKTCINDCRLSPWAWSRQTAMRLPRATTSLYSYQKSKKYDLVLVVSLEKLFSQVQHETLENIIYYLKSYSTIDTARRSDLSWNQVYGSLKSL